MALGPTMFHVAFLVGGRVTATSNFITENKIFSPKVKQTHHYLAMNFGCFSLTKFPALLNCQKNVVKPLDSYLNPVCPKRSVWILKDILIQKIAVMSSVTLRWSWKITTQMLTLDLFPVAQSPWRHRTKSDGEGKELKGSCGQRERKAVLWQQRKTQGIQEHNTGITS